MAPFSHSLFDEFTIRAIDLQKLTAAQRNKALAFLRKLEQDLVVELAKADLPGYQITAYREARLRALLQQTKDTISTAYKKMVSDQQSDYAILADAEQKFVRHSINQLAGVELASVALTKEQLTSIASNTLIHGAPSAEWWKRQALQTQNKFADVVRLGVAKGEPNDAIVRNVRNKVTRLAADNIDALVRSSVQTISSQARVESMLANDDVIEAIQQHSTLDGRTTLICMSYSGQRWKNTPDHEPLDELPFINDGGSIFGVPRHFCCRSSLIPVVKSWDALGGGLKTGGRPAQDVEAYFRSRLKARGFDDEQIAAVIRNAQASMDGSVPESMNYEQWLRTKPVEFQKAQLGPARYDLWHRGKLTFTELVDRSGEPMTVHELLRKTG